MQPSAAPSPALSRTSSSGRLSGPPCRSLALSTSYHHVPHIRRRCSWCRALERAGSVSFQVVWRAVAIPEGRGVEHRRIGGVAAAQTTGSALQHLSHWNDIHYLYHALRLPDTKSSATRGNAPSAYLSATPPLPPVLQMMNTVGLLFEMEDHQYVRVLGNPGNFDCFPVRRRQATPASRTGRRRGRWLGRVAHQRTRRRE